MIPSSTATSYPFSQVMDRSPHESAGALGSGAEKKVAFGAVAVSRSSLLLVPLVRGLWRAAARVLRPPLRAEAEAERVESVRSPRTEAGIGGEYRRVGRSLVTGGYRTGYAIPEVGVGVPNHKIAGVGLPATFAEKGFCLHLQARIRIDSR